MVQEFGEANRLKSMLIPKVVTTSEAHYTLEWLTDTGLALETQHGIRHLKAIAMYTQSRRIIQVHVQLCSAWNTSIHNTKTRYKTFLAK